METTKARRDAAILFIVVFLLGALLGAAGNHLWQERVYGQQRAQQSVLMPSRAHIIEQSTRELQLTPDQQKQLGIVIDDTRRKWDALYAPLDAQREQIRQEGRASIRAVLSPEQQVKFDDFMRRLDDRRKKEAAERQEQR